MDMIAAFQKSLRTTAGALETPADRYDQIAKVMIARKTLYVHDAPFSFASELCHRAGGFMMARRLKGTQLPAGSQVVIGRTGPSAVYACVVDNADQLEKIDGMVDRCDVNEAFCRMPDGLCGVMIDPEARAGRAGEGVSSDSSEIVQLCREYGLPEKNISATLAVAAAWSLQAELVAACTRQGQMPVMYESVLYSSGRDRIERYRGQSFQEYHRVPPAGAHTLGREYLATLCESLDALGRQTDRIHEAAELICTAIEGGHVMHVDAIGHSVPDLVRMPDQSSGQADTSHVPPYTVRSVGLTNVIPPEGLGDGDVVVFVGYCGVPHGYIENARQRGIAVIVLASPTPHGPITMYGADVALDTGWSYGDAALPVSGYDIRILPPSGFVQSAAFWSLMARVGQLHQP